MRLDQSKAKAGKMNTFGSLIAEPYDKASLKAATTFFEVRDGFEAVKRYGKLCTRICACSMPRNHKAINLNIVL
jgi:hypothetical protein